MHAHIFDPWKLWMLRFQEKRKKGGLLWGKRVLTPAEEGLSISVVFVLPPLLCREAVAAADKPSDLVSGLSTCGRAQSYIQILVCRVCYGIRDAPGRVCPCCLQEHLEGKACIALCCSGSRQGLQVPGPCRRSGLHRLLDHKWHGHRRACSARVLQGIAQAQLPVITWGRSRGLSLTAF